MEDLICRQGEIYEQINKNYSNYRKSPKERLTKAYIETRYENLELFWQKFVNTHFEIVSISRGTDKSKLQYFELDVYSTVEESYCLYKSKLKEDLEARRVAPTISTSLEASSTSEVKLPSIQVPNFSGDYEKWQAYYDMFLSLIHNNHSLSAVQKLHYLKNSLSGEPEALLRDLSVVEANYEEAWEKLKRRYNNKRYNSNEILKRLFSQRSIMSESASAIKNLLDTTSSCMKSLKNLDINTESWDVFIIHLVVSKLDYESRRQWETEIGHLASDELPTWDKLVNFLEMRFRTLEILDGTKPNIKCVNQQVPTRKSHHSAMDEMRKSAPSSITCPSCTGNHLLYQCKGFESLSPIERSKFVQENKLCFNCFGPTHSVKFCRQSTSCRKCGRRHHSMLHFVREREIQDSVVTESQVAESSSVGTQQSNRESARAERVVAHFAKESKQSEVLLATAMVKIKSANGYTQILRVLIDQGSEASFVSEATVQALGLKRARVNGLVSGIGNGHTRTKSMVSFNLESLIDPEFSVQVNAFVLSSLTSFLPSCRISVEKWHDINNLPLADPSYSLPGKIDVILGVEVHSEILLEGLIKHPSVNGPIAQKTTFGWILSGRVQKALEKSPSNSSSMNFHIQFQDDELLKRFWEIEREPDSIKKKMTLEEQRCEEIFDETTMRNSEGRYIVRLPFNSPNPECLQGGSREIALQRFYYLEKKLLKKPKEREDYKKVIEDYLQQNHMEMITDKDEIQDLNAIYLPHHAVIREDKETTKVRVVYDASCKGRNNVSLNDNLLIGPRLQHDLRHILMRWRSHKICIVADLVQMYRQIIVNNLDVDFQRIFWRSDPNDRIQHYRLLRLTFGTACAPYLAVKSLLQLAKDECDKYSIASEITLNDFYMDDLLTGCDDVDEAITIFNEMNKLMKAGGFTLQKWCSNSYELLQFIKEDLQSTGNEIVFKENETVKILGICWNKLNDEFVFTMNLPDEDNEITKRKVLSHIARLYDPLGWIAPVIVTAKIFIQKLWKSGLNWDVCLTAELASEWNQFRSDLVNIKRISIPRWLSTKKGDSVELHVFADASRAAYAAAVYMKVETAEGIVNINLITAKTKVAPIEREISIPRLELCAALLAAKLIFEVAQVMNISKDKLFAWSDSTIVLAWLYGESCRWVTFVSNRVSEILTMLDREQWRHIDTNNNPADCASRGMLTSDLLNHKQWWNGPNFLRQGGYYNFNYPDYITNEEERKVKILTAIVKPTEDFIWKRFSNLIRGLRVLSYCRKFINLKLPEEQRVTLNSTITVNETIEVLKICIRETQKFYFTEEINRLKAKEYVRKKSHLYTLSPFLDEDGIIRVGGRIQEAQIDFDKRHPIILPNESHLTKLIVLDAHVKTLHGGPQLMLNILRYKYWIIRARERIKKCYRDCVICLRYTRQNTNQFMGQLPDIRTRPARAFEVAGVDFTGHINIRFSPGRGSKLYKGYVCLFICLSTKAIHLEAVSDLSAQGFIAAFRRFVSRRGHCRELYSDNGTNFIGANKELKEMHNKAVAQLPDDIRQLLGNDGTSWKFIPPYAPNFGGLWEAGVRSAKNHLKKVIGCSTLTFEELSTVLSQIEACLNSRPLSYLSDNPDDPLPLTPGHFLIGEPLIVVPDENYEFQNISGLRRWKFTQKILNDFWRKWSDEYLVTLNQRHKWSTRLKEPEIGDIVLIKEQNLPPSKWLLGRVAAKHPGKDDITRVVTVKTKNGLTKRATSKLFMLPKAD